MTHNNSHDNISEKNEIKHPIKNDIKKTILILSGGGIKGIAHIGAMKALDEKNILKNIKTFVGTSVGGFVATLYLIGYGPDKLYEFIEFLDVQKMRSLKPAQFITKFGLDNGEKLMCVLEKMFLAKNIPINITFKTLFEITNIKLILTTVCLNDKKTYYLSHLTYPDMPVLMGLRMTSCVPIWFTPIEYDGKLFVDGGCMDNYPIDLFVNELDNVVGIYLYENKTITPVIDNMEEYLFNLMYCFMEGITCKTITGYEKQTIRLELPAISITNLDITNKIKKDLFNIGYDSVMKKIL